MNEPLSEYQAAFELLRNCARTELGPHQVERITALAEQNVDWALLYSIASRHRVLPLLRKSLFQVCPEAIPEGLVTQFNDLGRASTMRNLFLVKELARLSELLSRHDIPSIALKGPVLAQLAYGDLNLRSYSDLDVLVPIESFNDVEDVLSKDGYLARKEISGINGLSKKLYIWQSGQFPFERGAGVFYLDLHTSIMPPLYHYPVRFESLWDRSQLVTINGLNVQYCSAEDVLQNLCYHGVKNRWEALKHICDVAELLHSNPDLDWDLILTRARLMRGERILYLGLYLARRLFETPLTTTIQVKIDKNRSIRSIGDSLLRSISRPAEHEIMKFGDRFRFHISLQDTLATKIRYGYFAFLRRVFTLIPSGPET